MNTEFERAFNSIAAAMSRAVKERSIAIASAEAERNGLIEQVDDKPSCLHVWERSESGNTLRFQWRWYDQSQAFSINLHNVSELDVAHNVHLEERQQRIIRFHIGQA